MRAYYASKISPNISKMPKEGYLICRNVPIARTGAQEYYGYELGPEAEFIPDKTYQVVRLEAEVFDTKAVASFEGKTVTDEHPNEDVTSENVSLYIKGTVTNVRRDEGAQSNLLLADLIIYDQVLIDEVMDGKREISCGYDCVTEVVDDHLIQSVIRGNHVAIVDAGRAGHNVSIKDNKPVSTTKTVSLRRSTNMAKMTLADKYARFLGMTKDANPEEAAAVLAEMAENERKTDEDTPPAKDTDNVQKVDTNTATATDEGGELSAVLKALKAIGDQVQSLSDELAAIKSPTTDNDPLAALEAELVKEVVDEESGECEHTVPAENIDEEPTIDEEITTDEDVTADQDGTEDEDPTTDSETAAAVSDKRMLLSEIKRMRPIVAGMKDQKAKKAITDSLLRLGKAAKGASGSGKNGYKQMIDARAAVLKKQSNAKSQYDSDAASKDQQVKYDAFNPHKKKGA